MKIHMIGYMAGLTSSFLWRFNPFSSWARKLHARTSKHYAGRKDVQVYSFSADGKGERAFFDKVWELHKQGLLAGVYGGGHSNGARDWLLAAKSMPRIQVDYLGLIDMALFDDVFGAVAGANIEHIDEFHGVLEYVNYGKDFKGTKTLQETKVGHTASANQKWVQDRIFDQITRRIP
jgi:hypothetical protein